MKVLVMHNYYGCDTGCCGHTIVVDDDFDNGEFIFDHPWRNDNFRTWAEDLVGRELGWEHVSDLDWENCVIVDD